MKTGNIQTHKSRSVILIENRLKDGISKSRQNDKHL